MVARSAGRTLRLAVPAAALADAIRRYQALGCWGGGIEIPRDLYEQALNVFESERELNTRHAYEAVVAGVPA